MKKTRLRVSDHAVVRYLERVLDFDLDKVRAEIAQKVEAADGHEACTGVVVEGFCYKLVDDTVTTVVKRNRQMRGQVR